jgi:hypothetical protein
MRRHAPGANASFHAALALPCTTDRDYPMLAAYRAATASQLTTFHQATR